ncbi:unnamed protein product [Blepharisma stoltei]|uniref:Protein kinase domain-containing protein n=1 Tax=Blepharisma stoltei TaxID=1481888 RepID=A0AAU9J616_9CILI|nr:unnamed protein product [Blepharisma stoltei]
METQLNIQGRTISLVKQISPEEYKAQDKNSGFFYLLKHIKNPTPQRIKQIKKEIRLLRELNPHPNIITLHSASSSEGSYFLMYEYCANGTLQTNRVQDPLKALYQIALGIKHMHQHDPPIVHRNLSPTSIQCQGDVYKISGLEYATEQSPKLIPLDMPFSNTDLLQISTDKWLAPECNGENNHSADTKTDIWGLGMIFYFILFENTPFDNNQEKNTFQLKLPKEVPQKVKDLLKMMLHPNPIVRADILSVLEKLDEQQNLMENQSCFVSCFPRISPFSRLKSGKSTYGLVQKACPNNSLPLKEIFIKKLVAKVWAKPQKISKFYTEMLRLQNLHNPQVRLKACLLLFLYLIEGPLYVFQATPGVVEVLHYIESFCSVRPGHPLLSEFFRRVTNAFSAAIKQKYYLTRANITNFNGRFVINKENFQFNDALLVEDLLNYWSSLLKIHEMITVKSHLEAICKSIRLTLIDEQKRLLEIISCCAEKLRELDTVLPDYLKTYHQAKTLFEVDNIEIPINKIEIPIPEILIEDSIQDPKIHQIKTVLSQPDLQMSENDSDSSSSSSSEEDEIEDCPGLGFTAVNLQEIHTHYSTAKDNHMTTSNECDLIDLSDANVEKFTQRLSEQFSSWQIDIKDVRQMRQIGNGSSSEVWLGLYQKTFVAIKKLKKIEKQSLKEFGREVNLLIKLRHPNLVLFMGAYIGEPLSVITEYCQGGDLFHLLHKRKDIFISWEQKLKMLKDVAVGMNFLHANNFIHRDLKSLNLFLSAQVHRPTDSILVKVGDFGLSKECRAEGLMTGKLGTCHWMAPEVLSQSDYSYKADVYSYAIVMYEVITREVPYSGLTHNDIKEKVLNQHARPDMEHIPPSCPKELKRLMSLCWRTDPNKRPSFAGIVDMLGYVEVPKS